MAAEEDTAKRLIVVENLASMLSEVLDALRVNVEEHLETCGCASGECRVAMALGLNATHYVARRWDDYYRKYGEQMRALQNFESSSNKK